MKKLFIYVRKGQTKTIDMRGERELEVRMFLTVRQGGTLRLINMARFSSWVKINGDLNLEGTMVMLRIGDREEDLRLSRMKVEKKPTAEITGYARRTFMNENVTLDVGPQPNFKEIEKHIASIGIEL